MFSDFLNSKMGDLLIRMLLVAGMAAFGFGASEATNVLDPSEALALGGSFGVIGQILKSVFDNMKTPSSKRGV